MVPRLAEHTVRGRLELRNAREHRRVERFFRVAQKRRSGLGDGSLLLAG